MDWNVSLIFYYFLDKKGMTDSETVGSSLNNLDSNFLKGHGRAVENQTLNLENSQF